MFKKKLFRIALAAGCDVVVFLILIICRSVVMHNDPLTTSMAGALWVPAICALLDIILITFFDTETSSSAFAMVKNIIYIVILVANLAAVVLMFIQFNKYSYETVTFGVAAQVALIGMVANALPIKLLCYFLYNKVSLPDVILPFVSVGSMVIGYLIDLLLFSIGLFTSDVVGTIMVWIFLFLPIAGFAGVIIYRSVSDNFAGFFLPFESISSFSGNSSASSSNRRSSSGRSTSNTASSEGWSKVSSYADMLAHKYSRNMSSSYSYSNNFLGRVEVTIDVYGVYSGKVDYSVKITAHGVAAEAKQSEMAMENLLRWKVDKDINKLVDETIAYMESLVDKYPELAGSGVGCSISDARVEFN